MKVFEPSLLEKAPAGFKATDYKAKEYPGWKFVIQVAPDDCTGCGLCVDVCPAKDKTQVKHKAIDMEPKIPHLERERAGWDFFLTIPDVDRTKVKLDTVKGSQFLLPLFEFSGACAGCGETPYVKLITQLFGDRMLIGNATGCSSIYGGNLPCTPYTQTPEGKGPAWSNSLFEDCAEFGMGFRLAIDQQLEYCHVLAGQAERPVGRRDRQGPARTTSRRPTPRSSCSARWWRRSSSGLAAIGSRDAKDLAASADYLVRRSVWSFGGDGWAYDIGFGGMDHVFASGRDVNILVLDTEVYSNTGGQASKSTPRGAVAKFAAAGKPGRKKDLGMIAMAYGNVYVGQIAMGANPAHALKVIREAESYRGTSLLDRLQPLHQLGHQHDHRHAVAEGSGELRLLAAVPLRSPRRSPSLPPGQQEADGRLQGVRHEGGAVQHPHAVQAGGCRPLVPPGPGRHQRALALLRAVGRRGPSRRQRRRRCGRCNPSCQ